MLGILSFLLLCELGFSKNQKAEGSLASKGRRFSSDCSLSTIALTIVALVVRASSPASFAPFFANRG